jgi:hypothetical protein
MFGKARHLPIGIWYSMPCQGQATISPSWAYSTFQSKDADLPAPDRHQPVATCRKVGYVSYDMLLSLSRYRGQIGLIGHGFPSCYPRLPWGVPVMGLRSGKRPVLELLLAVFSDFARHRVSLAVIYSTYKLRRRPWASILKSLRAFSPNTLRLTSLEKGIWCTFEGWSKS